LGTYQTADIVQAVRLNIGVQAEAVVGFEDHHHFFDGSVTGAFAEPLSPGYPAGVRAARGGSINTAAMIGVGAVIMAGVGILASGSSSVLDTVGIPSQPAKPGRKQFSKTY